MHLYSHTNRTVLKARTIYSWVALGRVTIDGCRDGMVRLACKGEGLGFRDGPMHAHACSVSCWCSDKYEVSVTLSEVGLKVTAI